MVECFWATQKSPLNGYSPTQIDLYGLTKKRERNNLRVRPVESPPSLGNASHWPMIDDLILTKQGLVTSGSYRIKIRGLLLGALEVGKCHIPCWKIRYRANSEFSGFSRRSEACSGSFASPGQLQTPFSPCPIGLCLMSTKFSGELLWGMNRVASSDHAHYNCRSSISPR